jgi:hypothetical protein
LADDRIQNGRETIATQTQRQGPGALQRLCKPVIMRGQPGSPFGNTGIRSDYPSNTRACHLRLLTQFSVSATELMRSKSAGGGPHNTATR